MAALSLNPIYDRAVQTVQDHALSPGLYCRTVRTGEKTPNPYGCADAANLLYTLNRFPHKPDEREKWVDALRSMQEEKSGFFPEGSHHIYHTTAHCTAALELFDARPMYRLTEMEKYLDFGEFRRLMESLDWLRNGAAAHAGAGIYAALTIVGAAGEGWRRQYFDFFNDACNPETGVWATNPNSRFTRYFQIGDAFHYLFNYGHAYEPIPYPAQLIDHCLAAYRTGDMGPKFGRQFHFIEMDWIYCLNRASQQTDHRFREVKETVEEFAEKYIGWLTNTNWDKEPGADDIHLVFGVLCCLAELQKTLPGIVTCKTPLRLVLDRRPFI